MASLEAQLFTRGEETTNGPCLCCIAPFPSCAGAILLIHWWVLSIWTGNCKTLFLRLFLVNKTTRILYGSSWKLSFFYPQVKSSSKSYACLIEMSLWRQQKNASSFIRSQVKKKILSSSKVIESTGWPSMLQDEGWRKYKPSRWDLLLEEVILTQTGIHSIDWTTIRTNLDKHEAKRCLRTGREEEVRFSR